MTEDGPGGADVVMEKVAFVDPAATVTLAGTVATAVMLEERLTTIPPLGAASLRLTVPVEELPPGTDLGFSDTDDKVTGGMTVSEAVCVPPAYEAESVPGVEEVTTVVVTAKAAVGDPAGTVTLDGTAMTAVLLLDSDTTTPPGGAAPLSVTIPVGEFPPMTLETFRVSEESEAGLTVTTADWMVVF